jgi:hypothetical protein
MATLHGVPHQSLHQTQGDSVVGIWGFPISSEPACRRTAGLALGRGARPSDPHRNAGRKTQLLGIAGDCRSGPL